MAAHKCLIKSVYSRNYRNSLCLLSLPLGLFSFCEMTNRLTQPQNPWLLTAPLAPLQAHSIVPITGCMPQRNAKCLHCLEVISPIFLLLRGPQPPPIAAFRQYGLSVREQTPSSCSWELWSNPKHNHIQWGKLVHQRSRRGPRASSRHSISWAFLLQACPVSPTSCSTSSLALFLSVASVEFFKYTEQVVFSWLCMLSSYSTVYFTQYLTIYVRYYHFDISKSRYFIFSYFIVSLQKPVCIAHLQHISGLTSYASHD